MEEPAERVPVAPRARAGETSAHGRLGVRSRVGAAAAAMVVAAAAGVTVAAALIGSGSRDEPTPADQRTDRPTRHPQQIAEAFVAFAADGSTTVPWSDRVSYLIEGSVVASLSSADASTHQAWSGCPPSEHEYAARACPVSPVTARAGLLAEGGEAVVEPGTPHTVGCSSPVLAAPAELNAASAVTIRPPLVRRDCFADFAVTLYLADDDRVSALALTLSGP
ncbi:hypothetical protein [Nocardioides nitrophenolicus]|uniref:hypothetical protein n=1 Tax=Nocardioides nitrophenolicus TaxID=60489 RepID=UPI00195764F9|nr:hypothetical protein [Nocardioides nitrophenolicus]MBM7516846.1 hypothetical protein [Nocardioides nitrophenolicus]